MEYIALYNTHIHTVKTDLLFEINENVIELFDKRTMRLLNEISSFWVVERICAL